MEGVLTGGALGLVLLYLVKETGAALARPVANGPVQLDDPVAFGPFRSSNGKINVQPVQGITLDSMSGRQANDGGGDGYTSKDLHGRGGALPGPQLSTVKPLIANESSSSPGSEFTVLPSSVSPIPFSQGGGGVASGGEPLPVPPSPTPPSPSPPLPTPTPNPPNPTPTPPSTDPLPQLVLVVVRSSPSAGSRSVFGNSHTNNATNQYSIQDSSVTFLSDAPKALQWTSERETPSMSSSMFNDATLSLIAEHVNMLRSSLTLGDGSDLLLFSARDLLPLGLLSAGLTEADVRSRTTTFDSSQLNTGKGDELVAIEAVTNLKFTGLGDSTSAKLTFDLLAQGLKDSFVNLGPGINTLTINTGFYRGTSSGVSLDSGLNFQFDNAPVITNLNNNWSFNLNARAVGVDNSQILFGDDNDDLTIFTRIDDNLAQALGGRLLDPNTTINLERIGLVHSNVQLGGGDDRLRINGMVIDSMIDLGEGNNSLFLEQPVDGASEIRMGGGANTIVFNRILGGIVHGGAGDDTFKLEQVSTAGELIGGGGNDSLESGKSFDASRDLLHITAKNQGFLNGLRFEEIPNVDLGGNDDLVFLDFNSSLTGQLLGGSGLDRLSFRSWSDPVSVDLDRGQATGLYGGLAGGFNSIEAASGGTNSDVLSASGQFSAIDGGDGDDLLLVRWTPWLASDTRGLQVNGGSGNDLIVMSLLDASQPESWDKAFGLPDLLDVDLTSALGSGDTLGWLLNPQEGVLRLHPSGLDGLGDLRQLPIAPLEQLLLGMDSSMQQLAVNTQPLVDGTGPAELVLLGDHGSRGHQVIAMLPNAALGVFNPTLTPSINVPGL